MSENELFGKSRKIKFLFLCLWTGIILASIKSIFTDTGFDNAYTIAMSYRHLSGDTLLGTMWEPHQTSIFMSDFLLWIYKIFVPDFTGVMIYMQICGTLLFALVAIALYYLLLPVTGTYFSQLACMFFIIFKVKQSPFPDYANLMILFSALLFTTIVKYLKQQSNRIYFHLSALLLCLTVLAYPSAVIGLISIWIILWKYSKKRWKDIISFTCICGVCGGIYTIYFVVKIGFSQLISNIENIIFTDAHSGQQISRYSYFIGIIEALAWIVCVLIIALLIKLIYKIIFRKNISVLPIWGICLFISEIAMLFLQNKTRIDWTCMFYIIPVLLTFVGASVYKLMNAEEKMIWLSGTLISLSVFAAAYLLSYLGLITLVAYIVLAGAVSVIPIKYYKKNGLLFLVFVIGLVTIHRGLIVWGYANESNIYMIQDVQTIMKSGPHKGIVCDYHLYHLIEDDRNEINQLISDDDNVFMVGGWILDSMEFLLLNASISNCTTIDVTYYNSRTIEYFTNYPEKTPSIVMLNHSFSQADDFVLQWIYENYELVYSGTNWDYYR